MDTYTFYTSILIFSTLSAYLYEKTDDYKKYIFYFFTFFVPFIIIAIRLDMGYDYSNYVSIFQDIKNGNYLRTEPGYVLINFGVYKLGLDVQYVFASMGFLFMYFSYKAFPKNGFAFSVFLFLAVYYFQGGFNQIRQGVSVAIMAYAMKFIYNRNLLKYSFYAFIAALFHIPTAIILYSVYFFANKKINKYIMILTILLAFIATHEHLITKSIVAIVKFLAPSYSYYLSGKYGSAVNSSYGMLMPAVQGVIAILIFYNKEKITTSYPMANLTINLYLLYIIFYFFRFDINIFSRVQYMFIFYFILSLVFFIKTFQKDSRLLIFFILVSMYFLVFIRFVYNGDIYIEHSTHIRPYKNIIFDKEL